MLLYATGVISMSLHPISLLVLMGGFSLAVSIGYASGIMLKKQIIYAPMILGTILGYLLTTLAITLV